MGFVGGHGEKLPGIDYETATQGGLADTGLTPEQRMYLATERARAARAQGQEPGPWASQLKGLQGRDTRIENRITKLQSIPEEERTARQSRRLEKLGVRHQKVSSRLESRLGGPIEHKVPLG